VERTALAAVAVLVGAAVVVAGLQASGPPATTNREAVHRVRAFVDERPLYKDYAHAVWNLVAHASLGSTERSDVDIEVRDIVKNAAPVSISVAAGALVLAIAASLPLGFAWSRSRRRAVHRLASGASYVAASIFLVWAGVWLAYYLGYRWEITPITGYCDLVNPDTNCGGFRQWAWHLLLPCVALALPLFAVYVRVIRSSAKRIRERRREDEPRLRREAALFTRRLGFDFAFALGLAVLVEVTFGLPGFGQVLLESIQQRDYAVLQGMLIGALLVAVAAALLADLVAAVLDPADRGAPD
jgi:peptide/nickel transport system permease protein